MKFTFLPILSALLLYAGLLLASDSADQLNTTTVIADGRDHDPWVFRTSLDNRTRMIVLALRKDFWVSYSTEYSSLYKVWRDGIKFDGMVYNQRSGPHPASRGPAYLLSNNHYPWRVRFNGKTLQPEVRYLGHRISNNIVTLRYKLKLQDNHEIVVEETPDYIENVKGVPGLKRKFETMNVPDGMSVELATATTDEKNSPYTLHTLKSDSSTVITSFFVNGPIKSATKQVEKLVSVGERLVKSSDCDLCHNETDSSVGPSYEAIAERYIATPDVITQLVGKVIDGGSGNWGAKMMTPHPDLLRSDGEYMIQYILGFNDDNNDLLSQEDPSWITVFFARLSGWLDSKFESIMAFFSDEEEKQSVVDTVVIEPPLRAVHPSFNLSTARPESFKPMVGGLDFGNDGRLYVTTWDREGAVYVVNGLNRENGQLSVNKIATGLAEPLGIKVLDKDIYVMQKQEFTRLRDTDNDGIIDRYDTIANSWPVSTNFHEFAFGLLYRDKHFYASLSTAVKPGGLPDSPQLPQRGTVIKIEKDTGVVTTFASGLRTPNGLGFGDDGALYVSDNQGSWLPANKIVRIKENGFYGFRGLGEENDTRVEDPPLVYIPQDDIGNSPSQPVNFNVGPYQKQLLYGDVTHGGLKRVSIDKIDDVYQGCVYRFSQGLEAGVNRLLWGPDGSVYVGGIGVRGNWKQQGKLNYGLQRLKFNGKNTFELLNVRVAKSGLELDFTDYLDPSDAILPQNYKIFSWYYEPTIEYGGPKLGLETLSIKSVKLDESGKKVYMDVTGLKKGRIIYLWTDLRSRAGDIAWSKEAWCTINKLPDE